MHVAKRIRSCGEYFFTKYTFSVGHVGKEVPVQVRCVIYNARIYLYIVCNIV